MALCFFVSKHMHRIRTEERWNKVVVGPQGLTVSAETNRMSNKPLWLMQLLQAG